jgi:hypothetical protein
MATTAAVAARTKLVAPAAAERTRFVSSPIPLAFPSSQSAVAPAQTYLSPESIARREHLNQLVIRNLLAVNQSHRFAPVVPILSCALCVDRQSRFRTSFNSAQYSNYSGEARKVKLSAPFRPEAAAMWQLGNTVRVRSRRRSVQSRRAFFYFFEGSSSPQVTAVAEDREGHVPEACKIACNEDPLRGGRPTFRIQAGAAIRAAMG